MNEDGSPPAPTPEALFERWRTERDPDALGVLFDLAAPGLFRLALSLVPDAATAEDALQETFVFAMEEADRWDDTRPVVPWLAGILRRKVLEARRRNTRAPAPERVRKPPLPDDPLLQAADAEERERVRVAILELEEPYREAALLRWRYGLEPAEIAEVKGVPPGTVSSWLHRAVEKLRVEMGALPAILAAAFPGRGIAVVRAQVIESAVTKALVTTVAVSATTGGAIVTGKVIVGVVVVGIVATFGVWKMVDGGSGGVAGGSGSSEVARGTPASPGPVGAPLPASPGSPGDTPSSPPGTTAPEPAPPPGTPPKAPDPRTPPSTNPGPTGAGESPAPTAPPAPWTKEDEASTTATETAPYSPALATATLRFRARVNGTPPKMRPIKFDADPKCGEAHKGQILNQAVVADREGRLANVVVHASGGFRRWTFAAPAEPAVLDQEGCMYIPHVLTVMVGQPITIRNSDPTMHNIHALPKNAADEFNKSQQPNAGDLTTSFTQEEVGVKVKCDVHNWMGARVGVFAHPFHGVTGADGTVTIKVPPGKYGFSAWHEYEKWTVKPAEQKVEVADGETKEIELVFGTE